MINYRKALVEIDEIINYLSINDYCKIPYDVIDMIQTNNTC